MYLRRCYRSKSGKRHAYWALVESHRTARGPRQRVVAWLGATPEGEESGRRGVRCAAEGGDVQGMLDGVEPEYVRIDWKSVRVERVRDFGGPWLVLQLARELGLGRLLDPSSDPRKLRLAEHIYEHTAMTDQLATACSGNSTG
jgi:hypothetical protein